MVKGLSNNGSNCFINTCLQVLLQTHQLNFLHSCSVNNNHETDIFVLDAWKDLVSEYNNQKISVVNPGLFIRIIRRCAKIKGNQMWITKDAIDLGSDILRNIVFHEIAHAVYGTQHDESCPLMCSTLDENAVLNKEDCLKHLLKYQPSEENSSLEGFDLIDHLERRQLLEEQF
mgnify:CR=1 FL=1